MIKSHKYPNLQSLNNSNWTNFFSPFINRLIFGHCYYSPFLLLGPVKIYDLGFPMPTVLRSGCTYIRTPKTAGFVSAPQTDVSFCTPRSQYVFIIFSLLKDAYVIEIGWNRKQQARLAYKRRRMNFFKINYAYNLDEVIQRGPNSGGSTRLIVELYSNVCWIYRNHFNIQKCSTCFPSISIT